MFCRGRGSIKVFINGKETLFRGGCLHHDSGILDAATFDESEWRRAAKMKAAGYNAISSAHNPASRPLLDACDALETVVLLQEKQRCNIFLSEVKNRIRRKI